MPPAEFIRGIDIQTSLVVLYCEVEVPQTRIVHSAPCEGRSIFPIMLDCTRKALGCILPPDCAATGYHVTLNFATYGVCQRQIWIQAQRHLDGVHSRLMIAFVTAVPIFPSH